jgi:hypothetical protein
MKVAVPLLVALLVAGLYVWAQTGPMAPLTGAQPGPTTQGTAPSDTGTSDGKEVEGTIMNMDSSGSNLTLEDGTQLMIPDSLRAARDALDEGVRVKATYKEQGGLRVATVITVWRRY